MARERLSSIVSVTYTNLFWVSVSFFVLAGFSKLVPSNYFPKAAPFCSDVLFPTFLGVFASLFATWVVRTLFIEPEMELFNRLKNSGLSGVWVSRPRFDNTKWCEAIRNAKKRCVIFGMASGNYRKDQKTEDAVRTCLSQPAATFSIYFLDPGWSEIVNFRSGEENRSLSEEIKRTVGFFYDIRSKLHPDQQKRFSMKVYRATPTVSITQADNYMIVTHYLASFPNSEAPIYILTDSGERLGKETLFHYHEENILRISRRETTIEINENNINEYRL